MTPDKLDYHPCPTCGVLAPVDRPHPEAFCRSVKELTDALAKMKSSDVVVRYPLGDVTFIIDPAMKGRPPLVMQMKDWQSMVFNECRCSAEPAPHCARCCAEGAESRTRCASLAALWGGA